MGIHNDLFHIHSIPVSYTGSVIFLLANKATGSELARVFSISSQEAATCEQGLLGTKPEAVSVLAGTGWP